MPRLHSTTPNGNVLEAPELWTPHYKGQLFTPGGVHFSEISLYRVVEPMFILHTQTKKKNITWISITHLSTGVTNTYLEVRINPINPRSVLVECTFFQPGYICTIDYGTDPSYTNLVYRDTSSSQSQMATITLSQSFSENTNYYYIVSVVPSESSSLHVRVQGRFRLSKYAYNFQKKKKKTQEICALYDTGLSLSGVSYSPYNYGFMITIAKSWCVYPQC